MKTVKKYSIFILGLLFFGFGISLGLKSGFGNNPMGVFVQGISKRTPLSIGICNMIVGLCEAGIGYALDKKNVSIATFVVIFCGSFFIDLANALIPGSDTIVVRILYMLLGIFSYCIGFSIQQLAECGLSNYDCFIFGLSKLFKTENYPLIRGICDFLFIVTGYFLGGVIGVGTLILVLFSGKIIVFLKKQLGKIAGSA